MFDKSDLNRGDEDVRFEANKVSDVQAHHLPSAPVSKREDERWIEHELDPYAKKLASPMHRFFERIAILFKVHVAMLMGILAGLVVFGLVPSLLAAYELLDESIVGYEATLFTRFFRLWKKHFNLGLRWTAVLLTGAAASYGIWYLLWYVQDPVLSIVANLLFFIILISLSLILFYYPVLRLYYPHMSEIRLCWFAVLFSYGHFATSLVLILVAGLTGLFFFFIPQFAIFIFLPIVPWASLVLTRRFLPKTILEKRREEIASRE